MSICFGLKIALVIPPSGFQLDERVYPMLGVLKVAAVLKRAGHRVRVIDLSAPAQMREGLEADHQTHGPTEVYGITATMPQMPAAAAIAGLIRRLDPGARILLGGAHVTMVNAAARAGVERSARMLEQLRGHFDTVVAGDGERAVFTAIQPDAPFLVDADRPGAGLFLTPEQVAEAPWPARQMIDLASYHCWVGGLAGTSVIGQLGCPYKCQFCGGRNSPTFRRMRTRPVQDIVAELCQVVDAFGYQGFMFLDDELNVSKAFPDLLRAMTAAQIARGEEWRLCGLLKSELFTTEQADLMYEAGFRKVLIGFESGDDRILKNMQKIATVADNTRAVETAHRAGLKVKALMSLGHPGESEQSIANTRDWLLEVKADEFDATVLTIYPGTPYHDEAVAHAGGGWTYTARGGDRLHFRDVDQFTDTPYYKGIPGAYESFVWTDHLTPSELVALRDELEQDVRARLGIAWPAGAAAINYEHSMGMAR